MVDHVGQSALGPGNSLWEFGHLLWRPLGWLLATLAGPVMSSLTDWTPFMQAAFVLLAVSALSSVVTVVLWYLLLIEVAQSRTTAFLVTLALACTHAFLLYAHSGCPYIPGLMCVSASLYCLRKDALTAAGVFYALGAALWFPFVLSGAGLALVAAGPAGSEIRLRDRLRIMKPARVLRFSAISAVVLIAIYGLGAAARQVTSVREAKAWFSESNHGLEQNMKALRLTTGLPRSFFFLGKDGIVFKRFLKHDPYAPVTITDLFTASLWKIAAFYVFLICLFRELWRSWSAWPLLLLLLGSLPAILFAVFLFEPSQAERYLPAAPFLVFATGWIFRDFARQRRATQWIIAGFLVAVVLNSGYSFAAPRVESANKDSWSRIATLRSRVTGNSVAVVATNQDELENFTSRSIFGAVNRPQLFRLYDVIDPASLRSLQWREEFATVVFGVWKDGGEVWISKRLWSSQPRPAWNWVEGDGPYGSWGDLFKFFSVMQTDADADGSDGFARLARNDANTAYLTPFGAAYRRPSELTAK
ncbi:MAG: hypothetical protein ABUS49_06630 [Acidobacteriota bacterium]